MWPGAKGCCSPGGHCKTKLPGPQKSTRDCKLIAFDNQKSIDLHIELPSIAAIKIDVPVPAIEALERWQGANPVEPSPPDLQVLNSTFLI